MKILAGAQRRRKLPASFTVTTPDTCAEPQAAASTSATAALAGNPFFFRAVWGLFLLSLAESMVLAGLVYRMPMDRFVDQVEEPLDPGEAQIILASQANLLGLTDRHGQANAAAPAYAIGPIHYPAVTRLEDADIPGLPANLAKRQHQAVTSGGDPAVPGDVQAPLLPQAEHQDLPAPDQIPRARMPVLDFQSILERALPTDTKPPGTPAPAPENPAPAAARASESPAAPHAPAAALEKPAAPIELYRPGGSQVPAALPPPGGMRITPRPAPAPASRPALPPVPRGIATAPPELHARPIPKARSAPDADPPPAGAMQPAQAATGSRRAMQAPLPPHPVLPARPLPPPEAMEPRQQLPRLPRAGPAYADGPPVIAPPPAALPPRIMVPVQPAMPRPPLLLGRPPGMLSGRPEADDRPPPGVRLAPRPSEDDDAPVVNSRRLPHDRADDQENAPGGPLPPAFGPAPAAP